MGASLANVRKDLEQLVSHYGESIARGGATPAGVSWPNAPDVALRYETLLSRASLSSQDGQPLRLLDLGCGTGLLLDWLAANGHLQHVGYTGVDASAETLSVARARWPGQRFEIRDVREQPFAENSFDWCIACGVFIARWPISHQQMLELTEETLSTTWRSVKVGLAFNVMSKHVDWERDDLFHWSLDEIMTFCKAKLSRHVELRLDYGLWEASVIATREPVSGTNKVPPQWGL